MMNQSIFQIKVVEVEHQEVITDGQVAIMVVDLVMELDMVENLLETGILWIRLNNFLPHKCLNITRLLKTQGSHEIRKCLRI